MRSSSSKLPDPTTLEDRLVFFKAFLRSPLSTGSITPSFKYLGRRMRRIIDEQGFAKSAIIEFGCGTGSVTRSFDGHEVIGLDLDERLLAKARRNCPFARFETADVCADGFELPKFTSQRAYLVSCIPVVNLGERRVVFERNLQRLFEDSRVSGFLQFTYLPKRPLNLQGKVQRRNLVLRNLPPAFIYCWEPSQGTPGEALTAEAS